MASIDKSKVATNNRHALPSEQCSAMSRFGPFPAARTYRYAGEPPCCRRKIDSRQERCERLGGTAIVLKSLQSARMQFSSGIGTGSISRVLPDKVEPGLTGEKSGPVIVR